MKTLFWITLPLLALIGLGSCAATQVNQSPKPTQIAGVQRTVDLSHVIRGDVPYPAGETPAQIQRDPQSNRAQTLTVGLNSHTMLQAVNAPLTATLDLLSPRDLVLPTVMLDLRDAVQDTTDVLITPTAILAWEQRYGPIPSGAAVLFATGWDLYWGDAAAYLSYDAQGHSRAPRLDPASVQLLVHERGVAMIGIDAPNQSVTSSQMPWLLLSNLTNIEQLPPTGTLLVVGALKVQASHNAPARVIALIP